MPSGIEPGGLGRGGVERGHGIMVEGGKVHGNQHDPQKMFGENITLLNSQTVNHYYSFTKNSNINSTHVKFTSILISLFYEKVFSK